MQTKNVHTKMRMVFPSRLVVSKAGLQTARYERNGTEQWIVTHVPIRHIAHRTWHSHSHSEHEITIFTFNFEPKYKYREIYVCLSMRLWVHNSQTWAERGANKKEAKLDVCLRCVFFLLLYSWTSSFSGGLAHTLLLNDIRRSLCWISAIQTNTKSSNS